MLLRTAPTAPDHDPSPLLRHREMLIGVPAAALCVLASVLVASRAPPEERLSRVVLEALIVGVPVIVGIYALRSSRNQRFGVALILVGYAWSLTALGEASASLPYSLGYIFGWTVPLTLIYLMLAFPEGRLETRVDRGLFGFGIGLVALLYVGSAPFIDAYPTHTPWASCGDDCPANAFQLVIPEPGAIEQVVRPVREGLTALLMLSIIAWLVHRTRTASPFRRHGMLPVIVMSVVCVGTLVAFQTARRADAGEVVDDLATLWSLTLPGLAGAFLAAMIRQRVMVGDTLSALGRDLNRRVDMGETRRTLARVLGDDSVDVLVPEVASAGWRDSRGALTSIAALEANGRRVSIVRDDDNVPVAAIAHDPALDEDDELTDSVRGYIRASTQHARVTRQLARSLVDLDQSRARIARAADAERSRIERDLHDGAQQRLIALRIRLSMAEELGGVDPQQWADTLKELGMELDETLDELRALAHGVYPSLLSDRGLAEALRSVAAEAPLPVRADIEELGPLPKEIQTAVYFTCTEAIQNACKHARNASRLRLVLGRDDGLAFEVDDDGPGFTLHPSANGGLRHMRDRIEAVGGVLTIDTAPGRGTRVCGFVPLSTGLASH